MDDWHDANYVVWIAYKILCINADFYNHSFTCFFFPVCFRAVVKALLFVKSLQGPLCCSFLYGKLCKNTALFMCNILVYTVVRVNTYMYYILQRTPEVLIIILEQDCRLEKHLNNSVYCFRQKSLVDTQLMIPSYIH